MRISVDPASPYFHREALLTDVYVNGDRADNVIEADDVEGVVVYNRVPTFPGMPGAVAVRNVLYGVLVEFRSRDERRPDDPDICTID